jgi:anti-anti-sigma regulatory factor
MPGCHVSREERAGRVTYTLRGKLDGASAWELRTRIEGEGSAALSIDFSQVSEFADYGVAVLAQSFADKSNLSITGLRQHTLRVFECFGVDCGARSASAGSTTGELPKPRGSTPPRRWPANSGRRT